MAYTLRCRRDMKRLHDKHALMHFAFCYAKAIEFARREERMGTEATIKGLSEEEELLLMECLNEFIQALHEKECSEDADEWRCKLDDAIALRRRIFNDLMKPEFI